MDWKAAKADSRNAWLRALERSGEAEREGATLPARVLALAKAAPDAIALLDRKETLTYRDLGARIEHYARWVLAQGLGGGDTVSIFVPNCADYIALWLGIARAGATAALLNTNLRAAPLIHAISAAKPKAIIVSAALAQPLTDIRRRLDPAIALWSHGGEIEGALPLAEFCPKEKLPFPQPDPRQTALLIYTSGTTGLPKAARLSHRRLMRWASWFSGMLDICRSDRLYDCLPLHHATGGVAAAGAALLSGASTIVRPKFSTRSFWQDVSETECSLFCYVGDVCRYLTDAPPGLHENRHRLRLCFGNGLTGPVWRRFQSRFRVPSIVEFYASTEGTFSLYNCGEKPGSVGRVPDFLAHRMRVELIRIDIETGEPLRDAGGLCVRSPQDEAGEAISALADLTTFEGYSEEGANARRILRNVFAQGDAWYRSGDLMRRDGQGYFYFVDRLGDSFRFKGENVSTEEMRQAIAACPCIKDVVVYGVAGPDWEGRAGMAALVVEDGFSLERLHRHLARGLPPYARPKFLRLCTSLETTATHKLQKRRLIVEGFDPAIVRDPLYRDDGAAYVAIEPERDTTTVVQMVPRGGIEPPTRGFSVRCSTD